MDATSKRVKVLKKPEVTDLAGEKVMIDFDSGHYVILKGAANDIWDLLQEDTTVDAIVAALLTIYDVEEGECRADTLAFLEQAQASGFIALE